MNHLKSALIIVFCSLFFLAPVVVAKTISVNSPHFSGKHINAVGAVFDIEGSTASVGSGTYIGNKRILTAGHIFYELLPKSVPQKSGPVTIDISNKKVYWTNQAVLNFSAPLSPIYRAKSLTVDAEFINNLHGNMRNPDQNDVKCDIAIITLEKPVEGVQSIALPNERTVLPEEGLLVGYGRGGQAHHNRHSRAQALHGLMEMGEWGILMSNLNEDMANDRIQTNSQNDTSLQLLLGKDKLGVEDKQVTRATQGDSGGPLLITTEEGDVQIIGIMSANSQLFNAFASLVRETPFGPARSHTLERLLEATK